MSLMTAILSRRAEPLFTLTKAMTMIPNLSAGKSSGSPQFASRDQSNLGLQVQPPKEAARARFFGTSFCRKKQF